MDCVNHSGVTATAFCQNCGKAICANCTRNGAGGQILCEPCWLAWQSVPNPFVAPPAGAPNPAAAAVLGLIPGVGAMYNGQFFKGLIHVVIFAVLISLADHYSIFGIFIAAWVLYQSFEAYHTARARRDGQPLPDPLGLNEVGNWLNLGGKNYPPQPGVGGVNPGAYNPGAYNPGAYNPGAASPGSSPGSNPGSSPGSNPGATYSGGVNPAAGTTGNPAAGGAYQPPYAGQYQPPYQAPYQAPYTPPYTPVSGFEPPIPPMPPPPPAYWKRKEPIGAVVLIALGLLFLLGQLDILGGRVIELSWPFLLIGLGIWLIIRRLSVSQGGPK